MIKLVYFSPEIIEQYIQYNIDNKFNLDNLRYLNQIVLSIKRTDIKYKFDKNIDLIIHNKKIKNSEILDFIITDVYYQNKNYNAKIIYRPLCIFDGIDISSLGNEFFKKWKTINFKEIFEYQFNDYIKKIASLIKTMKDFEILFKLFNIEINKEPPYAFLVAINNRFFEIINTYSEKDCPKFIEHVALLICLIDKKNLNLKSFLTDIQTLLDIQIIIDIYIKTLDIYIDYLSKNTIYLLINFLKNDNIKICLDKYEEKLTIFKIIKETQFNLLCDNNHNKNKEINDLKNKIIQLENENKIIYNKLNFIQNENQQLKKLESDNQKLILFDLKKKTIVILFLD